MKGGERSMNYLDRALEPGDHYINKYKGIRLPNDAALKDPVKLAELSGPVIPGRIEDLKGGESS